jgi:hypothetical protein
MANVPHDLKSLESAVRNAVANVTITDIHTHLFPPSHSQLQSWGIDELLTYHYLIAELFMVGPRTLDPAKFYALPKSQQADLVWEHVFLRHGPISEAARGVLTVLSSLGLDISSHSAAGSSNRKLDGIRRWFAQQKIEKFLPRVFELAGLDYAVMTNDPFIADEVKYWQQSLPVPPQLKAALRIEVPLLDWPAAAKAMRQQGYKATVRLDSPSLAAARKFILDWAKRTNPLYLAASLRDDYTYPSKDAGTTIMDKVIVPAAAELGLPIALMIGVRRRINPALGWAGDGCGICDPNSVKHLCQRHGDAKFMVTMLERVNQQDLCVLARKFRNLHVFGCWWFCNTPSGIEEITRMRLELLGTNFTAQHSDARVLEQLIYKWSHSRKVIADVLVEKYRDIFTANWRPTTEEIQRDVRNLLGGSFESFK